MCTVCNSHITALGDTLNVDVVTLLICMSIVPLYQRYSILQQALYDNHPVILAVNRMVTAIMAGMLFFSLCSIYYVRFNNEIRKLERRLEC